MVAFYLAHTLDTGLFHLFNLFIYNPHIFRLHPNSLKLAIAKGGVTALYTTLTFIGVSVVTGCYNCLRVVR